MYPLIRTTSEEYSDRRSTTITSSAGIHTSAVRKTGEHWESDRSVSEQKVIVEQDMSEEKLAFADIRREQEEQTTPSKLLIGSQHDSSSLVNQKVVAEYLSLTPGSLDLEVSSLESFPLDSFLTIPATLAVRLATKAEESNCRSVNILVIGKRGSGKTSLINALLGQQIGRVDAFRTGTVLVEEATDMLKVTDTRVCFIDTPGVPDNDDALSGLLDMITNAIQHRPIHAILYLERLSDSRISTKYKKNLERITKKLGPRVWRKAIIVLTCGYVFPPSEYTFEEFIRARAMSVRRLVRESTEDPELQLPVAVSEVSSLCPTNEQGLKTLPDGTVWLSALVEMLCRRILSGRAYVYQTFGKSSWKDNLSTEPLFLTLAALSGVLVSRLLFSNSSSSNDRVTSKTRRKGQKGNSGNLKDKSIPSWWPFKGSA